MSAGPCRPAIEVTALLKVENRRLPSVAASFIGALLAGARALAYCTLGIADAIVSAHIRALMAPQPTDVASPDRHTVKSWFKGKLAFAPVVEDLAAEGFALIGARIDVTRVPAICGNRLLPRHRARL